ncbi:MAG: hypothetical protein KGL59_11400 [Acidobacteriota bacterium]|nr:hypothetical protein [Acidobacteriota bacterium]
MFSNGNLDMGKTAMRRAVFGLLTIIFTFAGVTQHASAAAARKEQKTAAPAAAFTATPVKSSYSEGEAILLLLGLKNTGQQTIIADAGFALGSTVQVSVTGPGGKAIDWAASFEAGAPRFQTVRPGNQITRVICLNCGSRDPFAYPFAEPGTYTVHLAYEPSGLTPAERASFPQAVALEHGIEAAAFEVRVTAPLVLFTARPAQAVFHVGDPVTFNFRLQNTGSQSVLAAYDLPLEGAVRLRVTDAAGKQVQPAGQPQSGQPLLSTIDAGSAIEASYPITPLNLYGTILRGFDIREPGTYTVEASYDLQQPIDVLQGYVGVLPVLIVPGPIAAPPVKFTVEPATAAAHN